MAATIGKLCFGGGAILFGYKIGNSTIDSLNQKSRYSPKKINERVRLKPGENVVTRQEAVKGLTGEVLDVLVIGGNLEASRIALDAASRGLKTGLLDQEDFDSSLSSGLVPPSEMGCFGRLVDRCLDPNIDLVKKINFNKVNSNQEFLETAPHLVKISKNLILIKDWWSLPVAWLGNKLSDFLVMKPPKMSTKLVTKPNAQSKCLWFNQDQYSVAVEISEVSADVHRLNLSTIISSVQWGAFALNHVKLLNIRPREDHVMVAVEDETHPICYEIKARVVIRADQKTKQTEYLSLPDFFCQEATGVSASQVSIQSTDYGTLAVFDNQATARQNFEQVKDIVGKNYILRRSQVVSKVVEEAEKCSNCELITGTAAVEINLEESVVEKACQIAGLTPLRPSQKGRLTIEGGHGWWPGLSLYLSSKFGLDYQVSQHLTSRYGDQADTLANLVLKYQAEGSKDAVLEAEVTYACQEMAQSLPHVIKRLKVEDEGSLSLMATRMGEELGWSKGTINKQVQAAAKMFSQAKELQTWKQTSPSLNQEIASADKEVFEECRKKFQEMEKVEKSHMNHQELLQILGNHEPFVSEEHLTSTLRDLDIYRNGSLNEDEFSVLMTRLTVKTPEEITQNHVQAIIEES